MRGTIVGVLRGGPSREHDVSLQTGAAMLANLPSDRFTTRDLYIDRKGQWHDRGRAVSPMKALQAVDVVLIGLHGDYGEDGKVQKLLEQAGVPYAGADSFASHLAMHKVMAKARAREAGLKVARDFYIEKPEDADALVREAVRTFLQPMVLKPVRWGSSIGVQFVGGYQPTLEAVMALFEQGAGGVLIEERIQGKEATAGVVEGLRGYDLYPLPPIEILPSDKEQFFTYDAKYSGSTREICPARFSRKENEELVQAAQTMHKALGLKHYSRSDFIISPRGIYYLETNTLPAMSGESLFPKPLAAIGLTLPDFFSHLVDLAFA